MIFKALRRAATSTKVLIIAALLFCVGLVGGTFADFTAETDSTTATYAGGWVAAPSTSSTVPANSGGDVVIVWTHATTGGGNSQAVLGYDEGTTSTTCSTSQTYTAVGTGITSTANTYTDTSDTTGSTYNGHYYCYEVAGVYLAGTSTTQWTTPTIITTPLLRGLVPQTMTFANGGGTANKIQTNDTLTVAFNQGVTRVGTGTVTVLGCSSGGTLLIGATSCTGTPTVAKISGLTFGGNVTFSTSTLTTAATSDMVVTLKGGTNTTSVSGTGTFSSSVSTATLKSTTTPSIAPCTTSACNPHSTGNF